MYAKESLEELRSKIQLIEVLSPHMRLTKAGGYYKGLCPFHSEKSPSFVVQSGDSHYHCFGCGAHGDAIAFLMNHLQMTFSEAVESLAEKFGIQLQANGKEEVKDPHVAPAKAALEDAAEFFHYFLLHTDEGHEALRYLYKRGFDNEFIVHFKVGLAPRDPQLFMKAMKALKYTLDPLQLAGLIKQDRPFFQDRIMIPIHHSMGYIIGFSGRSFKESTFGPKYVNTAETPFFKKSKILFGYHYSRKRIAKEQRAIIVEGQFDALRLIQEGFNYTVASQGTAFGEEAVSELVRVGVKNVYLAFDSDNAGREASIKVGQMFQKEAVAVWIVDMPDGADPDSFLKDEGAGSFMQKLDKPVEYLDFLIKYYREKINTTTPAGKNEHVRTISSLIRAWEHPLMVHEGLKKLAREMQIPDSMVDKGIANVEEVTIKRSLSVSQTTFDPDRILETDLLRLMILAGPLYPDIFVFVKQHITSEDFFVPICAKVYETILEQYAEQQNIDLIPLVSRVENAEQQLFLADILQKKISIERAKESTKDTIKKILERNWMKRREEIKSKIQAGGLTEEEILMLAKAFDDLKKLPPVVSAWPSS